MSILIVNVIIILEVACPLFVIQPVVEQKEATCHSLPGEMSIEIHNIYTHMCGNLLTGVFSRSLWFTGLHQSEGSYLSLRKFVVLFVGLRVVANFSEINVKYENWKSQ